MSQREVVFLLPSLSLSNNSTAVKIPNSYLSLAEAAVAVHGLALFRAAQSYTVGLLCLACVRPPGFGV